MTLKGKTALVTGGTKGIGRAVSETLAQNDVNVIINYTHDDSAAAETEKALKNYKSKCLVVKSDISNQREVESMFAKIKEEFGHLDILVNNAAVFDDRDGPDSLEAFENIFKTNLIAQVAVTNEARQLMKQGKIIFISSIHGKLGHGRPSAIAYSAAKAALNSYMKNLAKELAPNILVNAIAPGRTLTPQWGDMTEEFKKEQASGHLINRWIEPGEIADGVIFLSKNDAVCGEVLVIDGGMSLKVLG